MSELNAIEEVVLQYFQALYDGDVAQVEDVFLPGAEICGYYEGERMHMKLPAYLAVLRNMSPPRLIGEDFDMRIDDIDHTGNVASVRTRYLFEALNYTDYLTLLKIDAGWKIACKAFHHD